MNRNLILLAIVAACAGCTRQQTAENDINAVEAVNVAAESAPSAENAQPGEAGGLPDDRNLVGEGPIDPKSGQGAGQVLQIYAALLEQGRLAEARRLWTEGGAGSGLSQRGFAEALGKYSEIHAEIGAPGPVEGAAGSAYVQIPLRFYGKLKSGAALNSSGTATLRRVNDVPGSTAEQRRWHIYRIDVQPPL